MAKHNPSQAEGIADDFFEQIFAYGGSGSGGGGGGVPGESANLSGMVLQLSSGELGGGVGGVGVGAFVGGGVGGRGSGGSGGVFPLGLSLDHAGGGYVKGEDGSGSGRCFRDDAVAVEVGKATGPGKADATSLFPAFGHIQPHQIRPNPPSQNFHGQTNPGAVAAGQHPPAPRPRVRARRGQATDPHSIAERLRRERIAERMRALQELVPNSNKTDRATMLDEIVDYVKFLRLQVKVLSMSRLGGAGAVAQLVADIPLSSVEGLANEGGSNQQIWEKWSTDGTEQQVAKLMEDDVGAAMQFLQSKALCIMPISLAATIYHSPHQQDAPSLAKTEPNVPS